MAAVKSSSSRSMTACESGKLLCIPPPISSTDMKLLEQQVDRGKKISMARRQIAGPVKQTEQAVRKGRGRREEEEKVRRNVKSGDLRQRKIEGRIDCKKKKEKTVEKVLTDEEKDLWENSSWRSQVKDLNESFSKLPPIFEGNKCVRKGQAFVVKLGQM